MIQLLIDDVWEEEHHVKMKFNRMIIYPSYMWHSAIMKKGWYKDKPRVSMSGFVFPECLTVDVNENERMGLLDYIFHYGDVLPTVDHRRLLELVRGLEFLIQKILRKHIL